MKRETFRSLENYKKMQTDTARSKGVLAELLSANSLTKARAIVYGAKPRRTGGKKQI